jgi:phage terminase small subunit
MGDKSLVYAEKEGKPFKVPPKVERFCQEYIFDFNGAAACIRAGYSKNGASTQATRMMANPKVAARVEELKLQLAEKTGITTEFVINGLREIADRCMQKVPVMKWDYGTKQMVQEQDENGNDIWMFDSQGANRAMELLGKHTGAFEADNNQRRPAIQINLANGD